MTDPQDKLSSLRKWADKLRDENATMAAELAGYADAWEAERAGGIASQRIPDSGRWIENNGLQPVKDDVLVDIEQRSGDVWVGEAARRWDFALVYGAGDVVRWRLHKEKTQ
jgi:hypothetical protein